MTPLRKIWQIQQTFWVVNIGVKFKDECHDLEKDNVYNFKETPSDLIDNDLM